MGAGKLAGFGAGGLFLGGGGVVMLKVGRFLGAKGVATAITDCGRRGRPWGWELGLGGS